jgi:hypothetical protein
MRKAQAFAGALTALGLRLDRPLVADPGQPASSTVIADSRQLPDAVAFATGALQSEVAIWRGRGPGGTC